MLSLWLAAGLAVAAPEMIPEQDLELVGRSAPLFELETLDGGSFSLEDARGSVVVLSFWASWCGPCRLELPALNRLQQERPDLKIVAVNVDRERDDAEEFLSTLEIGLPVALDNQAKALGEYAVMSMPTMFLVDTNGTVKFQKTGFSREKGLAELEAAIDGLK
jgi:thiol-disulfide isomerase/thioredoxin